MEIEIEIEREKEREAGLDGQMRAEEGDVEYVDLY